MCAHSASGQEITGKISNELYPYIDQHIFEVVQYLRQQVICNEASVLFDLFYSLKTEFEALKNYNIQLVFPAVLQVFDTKDKPATTQDATIESLQQNTLKKERALLQLITDIEQEVELLQFPEHHAIFRLIAAFKIQFVRSKEEWNRMLQNWNSTCACFAAANRPGKEEEKHYSLENHG